MNLLAIFYLEPFLFKDRNKNNVSNQKIERGSKYKIQLCYN